MSNRPIPGDYTLTARQLQLTRGVLNVAIEYATRFDNPIAPAFDSTRLPHMESAREVIGEAFDQVADGGTWTGRMHPSEMRATRMAVGWVESELTGPQSELLEQLPINPRRQEIDALGDVLDGLTPAPDVDVANSDWRVGVNTDAISNLQPRLSDAHRSIRAASSNRDPPRDPTERAGDAMEMHQRAVRDCGQAGVAVVDLAIAVAESRGPDRGTVMAIGNDLIDSVTGGDCFYSDFHRESLRAAWGRVQSADQAGDELDITLGAMDVTTAWFWSEARKQATRL